MEISSLLILLPGLVAFGISKALSGVKSRPVNEIVIDLVLQTVFVFVLYYALSQISTLNIPTPAELIIASLKAKAESDPNKVQPFVDLLERGLFCAIEFAFLTGTISALFKEWKVIQRLGRRLWLFQSDAEESAWKKTFDSGSSLGWLHVDTKGGKRYVGLGHAISWEHKDGGIGLSKVKLYDNDRNALEEVADFIYIPSDELDGPVLFVKGT